MFPPEPLVLPFFLAAFPFAGFPSAGLGAVGSSCASCSWAELFSRWFWGWLLDGVMINQWRAFTRGSHSVRTRQGAMLAQLERGWLVMRCGGGGGGGGVGRPVVARSQRGVLRVSCRDGLSRTSMLQAALGVKQGCLGARRAADVVLSAHLPSRVPSKPFVRAAGWLPSGVRPTARWVRQQLRRHHDRGTHSPGSAAHCPACLFFLFGLLAACTSEWVPA